MESHQTSDLGKNPCFRAIDAPEWAKDAGTAKGKSATSGPSAQLTECPCPEHSSTRMTPTSDSPVHYPSIAVVEPPPSWKQHAIRRSKRAAVAACNKRLHSGWGTGSHQDLDASFSG
ncbi:hypothetical protein I7I48_05283 [Histoplasma ohiense]|nr:hypothetical protein I7I48_05283 [Histoplasma ohiense (nom. inval.)]